MIKKIIILLFLGLIVGDINREARIIKKLKSTNDSLIHILESIDDKYIFDSITVRDIPSFNNSYDKGSIVSGEIVIVAYNSNEKTNVIFGDSIFYVDSNLIFRNPDTLKLENGGFKYQKKLGEKLKIQGAINVESDYGKNKQIVIKTLIKSKE